MNIHFEPKYINQYSHSRRKVSSDTDSKIFIEKLKSFYYPSLTYIQATPNCIFSFDKCSGLVYWKVWSLPMLHFYFTSFFIVTWMIWWNIYKTDFDEILGIYNVTDTVGNYLASLSTVFAQYIVQPNILLRRAQISIFWNNLHKVLEGIYTESSLSNRAHLEKELRGNGLLFRNSLILMFICILVKGSDMARLLLPVVSGSSIPLYRSLIHSIGIIYFGIFFILALIRVVWFALLLSLISIGFSSLKDDFKGSDYLKFLKNFTMLEELVAEFNEIFWVQIVIAIIGIGTILINYTYNTFTSFGDGRFIEMSLQTGTLIVPSFLVLYILCSFGTNITEQAQSTMTHVYYKSFGNGKSGIDHFVLTTLAHQKNSAFTKALTCPPVISPGNFFHVNRRTLTSILSGILTYIIVLLQFRSVDIKDPNARNVSSA